MRVRSVWIAFAVAAIFGCAFVPAPACAAHIFEDVGVFSAPILGIDPSTRSAAMGGASTAVFWGDGPNDWANPALLGGVRGIRFEGSGRDLPSYFVSATTFRRQRLTLGAGGIGVSLTGQPLEAMGEQRLESPPVDFVFISAYDTTALTIHSKETERSWGMGVSLAESFESLARWRGHEAPAWTRRVDVAFGLNRKTIADYLLDPGTPDHFVSYDWGALARTSLPLRRMLASHPGKIDVAIATAVLDANGSKSLDVPAARQQRTGGAVRTSIDAPLGVAKRIPAWLSPGITSLASVALAYDTSRLTPGSRNDHSWRINSWGAELGLGGLLFARVGGAHNSSGSGSTNHTWGVGAALPVGHWGAVHYDYARVDLPSGIRVAPQSWAVVVDPVAIARDIK